MNYLRILILVAGTWMLPIGVMSAETSLQEQINETPSGGMLTIQSGTYEGPIELSKPIDLVAQEGAVIVYSGTDAAIAISGHDVSVSNLTIKTSERAAAAIKMTGKGHELIDLDINTEATGIMMDKVSNALIEGAEIVGPSDQHAIDMKESDNNMLQSNHVKLVEDGFYVEDSNQNTFKNNEVSEAHYGFHIMYSEGVALIDNQVEESFTGAMVMGADGGTIKGNVFKDNNRNVNAQGLLLYDSTGVNLASNELINNRIGLFIEEADANEVRDNLFLSNYIAIQFLKAEDNSIIGNEFRLNLNEAQAIESKGNSVEQNYWDSAVSVDVNNDEFSDLAYVADPYFLSLTDEVPEYQLFFQSPGMLILQNMLKSSNGEVLMDTAPLLTKQVIDTDGNGSTWHVWAMTTVMVGLSATLFLIGRKKS